MPSYSWILPEVGRFASVELLLDVVLGGAVEHRRREVQAQSLRRPAQVRFENLATFIRQGTPSGLSTISTGVPSGRYGMSSSGTMRAITPLLPWRPAILSPTDSLRFMAM